jgi:hypothetical protein
MLIALCTSRCYLENFCIYHFSCLNLNVLFFFLGYLKIHVQFLKVIFYVNLLYYLYAFSQSKGHLLYNIRDILGRDECGKCFHCNEQARETRS